MILLLNLGLLSALLISPAILLMAYWYRKQMPNTIMEWKKPELVLITVVAAVAAVVIFIIGLTSLFTHLGYLKSGFVANGDRVMRDLSLFSLFAFASLSTLYIATRILLIQVVTHKGIVMNDKIFRIPNFKTVLYWKEIADYYVKSDYPNVVFTLIIREDDVTYERISLKVPVYFRDRFERLLEEKMENSEAATDSSRSRFPYPEN
ncbi:MAG: hypothetical protein AB8F95_22165 [Bacteroidia bacterium]